MTKCVKEKPCHNTTITRGLVERSGFSGKGLQHVVAINFKTEKSDYLGIMYKTSSKDNGTMLNFCPWCGANIQFWD